jgi:hypothetical protein
MEVSKAFTEHPTPVGETCAQHFGQAIGFGTRLVLAHNCMLPARTTAFYLRSHRNVRYRARILQHYRD